MKRSLALFKFAACALLLAHAEAAQNIVWSSAGRELQKSGGSGTGSGGSGGGGGGGGGQSVKVTDNLAVGAEGGTVTCASWDPSSKSWGHTDNTKYGATGGTKPPSQASQYGSQVCSNPQSAGQALYKALQSGGTSQDEQAWVYGLFVNAADSCPDAAKEAYSVARTAVDDATKSVTSLEEYLPVLAKFHKAIVDAGDALGIPMCVTVAIVDATDGSVVDQAILTTKG